MNIVTRILLFIMLASSVSSFMGRRALKPVAATCMSRRMITITNGVEFDTIAREWRMKWTPDNDKKSLADVQQALNKYTTSLKGVEGVKGVQRIVCGGCQDYKVIVSLSADKFGAWVRLDGELAMNRSFD